MGKKSTRENKNIYQLSREKLELTRDGAEELLPGMTADRIEKIESGKVTAHPEEILLMQEGYGNPELYNYYCTHECPIGRRYVPEVRLRDISKISLEVLASLNALEAQKNRLVDITVDGVISEDEKADFDAIRERLRSIAETAAALDMWMEAQTTHEKQ